MPKHDFTPISTEYDQSRTLFPEEFPEGPYGSMSNFDITKDEWKDGTHAAPRFTYETRGFHENLARQDEGSHPVHDDPNADIQPPYDKNVGATDL